MLKQAEWRGELCYKKLAFGRESALTSERWTQHMEDWMESKKERNVCQTIDGSFSGKAPFVDDIG